MDISSMVTNAVVESIVSSLPVERQRACHQDLSFRVGMKLKTKCYVEPNPYRLAVNVGHDANNFALHFNLRFPEMKIIINSCQSGSWGQWAEETYFPFKEGQEFELAITFDKEYFDIWVNDAYHTTFPNRKHDEEFKYICFDGDLLVREMSITPN